MSARTLVLSDLHFGSGDEILRSPTALNLLRPQLEWSDTLILNGDVWDLTGNNLADAVTASKPFFDLIRKTTKQVIYLPGNHDYHFVAASTDRHQFSKLVGIADETPFRLYLAELLLKELTEEKVNIRTAYPIVELDGIVYHHGHYMTPHLRNLAWRMFDKLSWHLAGLDRNHDRGLTSADYEALLAPLHELLYHSAQLPSSQRTRQSGEKFLTFAATVLRAPGRLSRRVTAPFKQHLEHDPSASKAIFQLTSPEQAGEAMAAVCRNLKIEAEQVCLGHSHAPFDHMAIDQWLFHNSGAWVLDHREKVYPHYRSLAWPGTVLAVEDGRVSRHELLANYRLEDLEEMLLEEGEPSLRPRKRSRRRRRRLQRLVV